jgi:hypothetical protein
VFFFPNLIRTQVADARAREKERDREIGDNKNIRGHSSRLFWQVGWKSLTHSLAYSTESYIIIVAIITSHKLQKQQSNKSKKKCVLLERRKENEKVF